LIKLPDTFAVLDLDSEIARFASDLDYLMAISRKLGLTRSVRLPGAVTACPMLFRASARLAFDHSKWRGHASNIDSAL
jgi:hypothetical protein